MKKILLFVSIILSFGLTQKVFAQKNAQQIADEKKLADFNKQFFNEAEAIKEAKAKGIRESDIKGYVEFLKNDFSSKRALEKQEHKHTPYETPEGVQETVIYLNPNRTTMSSCTNMGFENYSFASWTGGIGSVSTGASSPLYTSTGTAIINTAGNNVSVRNTTNYHTLMTMPATNNLYPNCSSYGYDSLACRNIGGVNRSEIPFVSPFSFDPVSVRLQQAVTGYRAAKLKYVMTTTPTNKTLAFSYAVVLNDPAGHLAGESPYFRVEIKNELTGAVLPGCTSYTFNPKTSLVSDSLVTSTITYIDVIKYRKWRYYTVDLSSLPVGSSVSVNFEVGGCSQSGHFGYAYVDAECGGIGAPYANMCSGSTFATLVAPSGFNSYQWLSPLGTPIVGANNDTLIVNPATPGQIYAINMVTPGGCTVTINDTVKLTSVNIININATSSCPGGHSGTAFVLASGSNGIYNYVWTSTSGPTAGSIVSTAQLATNLAPGTYSVLVASTTCGTATGSITVGISPPYFTVVNKPFCGNSAFIKAPSGTGYQWYGGSAPLTQTLIPAPVGTNDTLLIPSVTAGYVYTLVYTSTSGCRDSTRYTMVQIPGGSSFFSGLNNVCPGNINGSVGVNLSTTFPAPYSYNVVGPGNTVVLNTSSSSTLVPVTGLAAGGYTATINDGVCIYRNTFTINVIQTTFSVVTTKTVVCFPTDTAKLYFNFGATPPSVCGVDPNLCTGPSTPLFTAGPFTSNSSTSYPTPYGNFYTYAKHQFLVRKAELNAAGISAGKISSLAFNVLNLNSSILNYPNFSIKMGCTNLSNLPTATFASSTPWVTGLTSVYSTPSAPINSSWTTHNFSQSYVWDGISNIVIEVCFGMNSSSTWIQNASVELKQMPYVSTMFYREDGTPVCSGTQLPNNSGGMLSAEFMLPNMKFGYCPAALPASSYTVQVSSNGTVTANYANDSLKIVPTFTAPPAGNVPTVYNITVYNPQGSCTASQTVAILYPTSVINMVTIPSTTTICEGTNLNLLSTGAVYYNWSYSQGGTLTPVSNTQMINVTPPHVGANYYIVHGTSPCPGTPDTKTVTVTVLPKADLAITPIQDITKCLNKPFVITTGVGSLTPGNPGTPYTYNWVALPTGTTIGSSSSFTTNSAGTTTLVLTVNGICANADKDTVVVKNFVDNLSLSILDSATVCANMPFTLNSLASGGYPNYNYGWFIDGVSSSISNTQNLSYTSPSTTGPRTITLYVNDSCGYSRAAYEVITVLPPCSITPPNVITPNGDNINDYFAISNIEYHANCGLTIFDRWGRKVYESSNYKNEWKADGCADGTFFYILDVPDDKKYTGFITVYHSK